MAPGFFLVFRKVSGMNAMIRNQMIMDWSADDRPREKLMLSGVQSLTDAELLAILLRSGSRQVTAVDLAKLMLADFDQDLFVLGKQDISVFMQYKGVGEAKAVTLAAAMELGRRRGRGEKLDLVTIRSSSDVYKLCYPLIGEIPHEEFLVLVLNQGGKVVYKFRVSQGGITATLVDIRLVFKKALAVNGNHLILVHNHPSGTNRPSAADISLTKKFNKAAEILDIRILDHVIVAGSKFYSFADDGKM